MGHRIALADALWAQGMVATRWERWEEAVSALEEGLAVARAMPYPYTEARTLETYGALHCAQGEADAARAAGGGAGDLRPAGRAQGCRTGGAGYRGPIAELRG